jgi:hypothetical protein
MITTDDLKTLGVAEDKAAQVIEALGDVSQKLTSETIVEKRVKKAFDDMDLETLSLTKVPKKDGEMATEYRKRAVNEFASKQIDSKANELNAKIADLETRSKENGGNESLKKELEKLKDERTKREAEYMTSFEAKTKEVNDKYENLQKEYDGFKKISTLKTSIPTGIKKEYSHEYVQFVIDKAIQKALTIYPKVDNDKDGNVILGNPEKFESIKANDFFKTELKDILEEQRNMSGGGGSGTGEQKQSELIIDESLTSVEKESKMKDYLIQVKGLSPVSNAFVNELKQLKIQYKLLSDKVK